MSVSVGGSARAGIACRFPSLINIQFGSSEGVSFSSPLLQRRSLSGSGMQVLAPERSVNVRIYGLQRVCSSARAHGY